MNIFQDLVEELKEENLLEETVIEPNDPLHGGVEPAATESTEKTKVDSEETEAVESEENQNPVVDSIVEEPADEPVEAESIGVEEEQAEIEEQTESAVSTEDQQEVPVSSEEMQESPVFSQTDEVAPEPVMPPMPSQLDQEGPNPTTMPEEVIVEDESSPEPNVVQESSVEGTSEVVGFPNQNEPISESNDSESVAPAIPESLDPHVKPEQPATFDSELENSVVENGNTAIDQELTDQIKEDSSEIVAEEPEIAVAEPTAEVKSKPDQVSKGSKFYKQRAMDEVTGLQLVEHVMSGVEREQMKQAPKSFDDLAVKRALHDFLKVAEDINSSEHATCEFQLMQETENWASALSRRDRNISVAHLRRFCETTKPSLSAQALISLARFYRNSPYSESVRGKYDLIMTRLFSKQAEGDKRTIVFGNDEFVSHIKELYADWSSVPLYATDDNDEGLMMIALKFQEFIEEANNASNFDQLVQRDFFKRLKAFKETTRESFFAPLVVATAVECNVAVGNRYIDLVKQERTDTHSEEEMSEKYSGLMSGAASEATSKTLEIVEMLNNQKDLPEEVVEEKPAKKKAKKKPKPAKAKTAAQPEESGKTQKILIAVTVVMMLLSGWFYFNDMILGGGADTTRANGTAQEFVLTGTPLESDLVSARISKSTLFGITNEGWSKKTADQKKAVLKNALKLGNGERFIRVQFLDKDGKPAGFASEKRVDAN